MGRRMKYITIKKLTELSGYSEHGIRAKIKKGIWLCNKHWIKAPDGRIFLDPKEIEAWQEGRA